MITQQAQIKLNLPIQLKEYIESKANKLGVPLAAYIKHLIMNDIKDMEYPTFQMSNHSDKKLKKAMKEVDRAVDVSVENYFKR